jgi:hypothetical protein
MARFSTQNGVAQRSRTRNNPLSLGVFSETSLRYLRGKLEATYRVQADGFGGGTYNHWFSVEITSPAWIIITKDGPRPNYIQVSFYDLNEIPIEGRSIFQADSVRGQFSYDQEDAPYYPYVGHVMGAQSDLYNTFNPNSLDRGDDRYYPLGAGKYLICVSSTRNEPLDYNVGVVIEFPTEDLFLLLEYLDGSILCLEDGIDNSNTVEIGPVFSVNYTLSAGFNAFTENVATINAGVTVEIPEGLTWLIGAVILPDKEPENCFLLDPSPTYDFNSVHEHSLVEWEEAWSREHQDTDRFPEVFKPLVTRP